MLRELNERFRAAQRLILGVVARGLHEEGPTGRGWAEAQPAQALKGRKRAAGLANNEGATVGFSLPQPVKAVQRETHEAGAGTRTTPRVVPFSPNPTSGRSIYQGPEV